MDWFQSPAHVQHMSYRTEVRKSLETYVGTWFGGKASNLRYLSRLTISDYKPYNTYRSATKQLRYRVNILETLANMYANTTWEDVIESLSQSQPSAGADCTLAVYNPFSAKLDWVSVPCERKHNISTVICKRIIPSVSNVIFNKIN